MIAGGALQEKIRPVAQGVERPVVFFPATRLWVDPLCWLAAKPLLPNSHQPKHNGADSGKTKFVM